MAAAVGLATIRRMTARRIGILGGTFDPFHCGHLDVGRAAETALGLTRLIVVTAHIPPHRTPPVASGYHRFAMAALAINGQARWQASDVELRVGAPSFTTTTLQRFHDEGYAPAELFFIIGADAFSEIESWRDYPAILDRAHFAVVSRPGFPVAETAARLATLAARTVRTPPAPDARALGTPSIFLIDAATADVSATAIRARVAAGESIARLVPPAVGQHIEQHALYASTAAAGAGAHPSPIPAAGRLHGQD
jgi:nicotinate-nucleotide adenylyltransferase